MPPRETVLSVDWAPDAILVIDSGGRIVDANQAAQHLFGYRRDELSGADADALIVGADGGRAWSGNGGGHEGTESRVPAVRTAAGAGRRRDGSQFAAILRWREVHDDSGAFVVMAVHESETPRAGLPSDAAAALEQHLDFLSLFNHDVRQSLQSIQFLCDSMLDRAPETAATIGEIVGSVKSLLDTVVRLGEAVPIVPAEEPCVVGDVLRALGRELEPIAERKGLDLVIDDAPQQIRTDPVLLRELLQNLMANAVRYTASGYVHVRCSSSPSAVRIDVVDTGVGIDDERLRDFFEAPAAGLRRRDGGGGLGLAIARRLADVLDCRIEASSKLGEGSRFTVFAPRTRVRQEPLRMPGAGVSRSEMHRH